MITSTVCIELAGEPKGGGHPGHGEGHQVVQVPVGRVGQLQGPTYICEWAHGGIDLIR